MGAVGIPRREDARLVTGRGTYVGDLRRDGMLHCAFVRSMAAHGHVAELSLDDVRAADGVRAAFAADDLDLPAIGGRVPRLDNPAMHRPPLARERVRYVGEPLVVVVADTPEAAVDGAERAWIDIAPLPPVVGVDAALAGDTLLFDDAGSNVVTEIDDGDDVDLEHWPVRVDLTVENQRVAPLAIEPLGVVAEPDGHGGVVVWCGHQAPHRLRGELRGLLGIDRVRVVVPDVGGGFGLKGMLYPEYVVVAAAALRLGRPVSWIETRTEHFLGGTHGRGMRHRVQLAGDRSGRLRAARVEIVSDVGAYPHNGALVPTLSAWMAQGPYDLEALRVRTTIVVTNAAPTGSYRGAGRPEAAYALERAVEAFASAADVAAVEVRRRSLVRADQLPYRTRTGALYDSGDYVRALDAALELADADGVRAEQQRLRARALDDRDGQHGGRDGRHGGRDGHDGRGNRPTPPRATRAVGLGVAVFVERAGGAADSSEHARVELTDDGIEVRVGSCDTGQGHATVWSSIVADVLGGDPHDVRVIAGDTGEVAEGTGTFASRSAQLAGSTLHRTATVVRDRIVEVAADMLEADPGDLRPEAGWIRVAGEQAGALPLRDVVERARERGVPLAAEETWSAHAQTYPYGAYVAVVEVDVETGQVHLRRMVAVDDCGRVLHPAIVEGQTHGSLAQGIAQALYEGIEYGPDGQPLVSTLIDYAAPSAVDLPPFDTARLTSPAPSNPLGVKGSGEAGCIGAPPAIVNAVLDALRPFGVTHLDMPLTPERIHRTLRAATRTAR